MKSPLAQSINKHGGGLFEFELLREQDLYDDPIFERFLADRRRRLLIEDILMKKLKQLSIRDNEH
jgi:hypothetical protein